MSEALSEKLSLLMWYTARFGFLLFFMVSQSWKMTLLTCMGLPIIWVIPELTGHFHQVKIHICFMEISTYDHHVMNLL